MLQHPTRLSCALLLCLHPTQVEGLKHADHSPSVLLLDEVQERLGQMRQQESMPQEQADSIHEGLRKLGRDDDNLPNSESGNQGQPDRIKYT